MSELGRNVFPEYVFAKIKTRPEVAARRLAWQMLRNQGLSFPMIARETGFKDHTTIRYGLIHINKSIPELAS